MPDLSELQHVRLEKSAALRAQGLNPYPLRSHRDGMTTDVVALVEAAESGDAAAAEKVMTLAGRVVSVRDMGKTAFAHLRDGEGQVQLYVRRDELGEQAFEDFLRLVDLGDIIEATGTSFRTRTGEPSLRVSGYGMLAKALNAPPEKWHGLQDVEQRYRQRYVDLIANAEVRDVFRMRARIVSAIRQYLDGLGYIEVETPVLQPLYGGAAARPFTTHHNALDQTFYLRIADELYLKRLIVGGFERVYEISKDFRNEGIDRNHSPEFTMLEFYEAFADYNIVADRTRELVQSAAAAAFGGLTFTSNGREIDLSGVWPKITLADAIFEASGIDYVKYPDAADLIAVARKAGADIETGTVWPRVVDELLKQFVRPNLIEPTFLINYPVQLSPLAKRIPDDPTHVERFQLYIGGAELANSFTELNDPIDQWRRFREQQADREAGDADAMPLDEDFVNALMYGMPPTGGVGIGIDRLTMLFADQATIRDVVLFPAMRRIDRSSQQDDDDSSTDDAEGALE
ncbi:MAG: lysine--tRNA ligase [Thermomicrobiales bacterium]|nr:lysine--tRNA ligase [Thermomicrobiales bacterium]